MQWRQLLSADRLGRERNTGPPNPDRSEFRRDSDRITFSTAFRRLQDKTQVFPLADNDYVRTRLTHSLEVSSVGRSLGARVGAVICKRHGLAAHGSDFGEIVAAAALAHDLGNPPFGHSGEDAIRHWFTTSQIAREASSALTPAQRADIERYEGNAQGFRLITRLQMPDNPGGMQLTHATLGAFTKYPRESIIPDGAVRGASAKKFGFCQSEREYFARVAEACGLIRRAPDAAWWARHPLAFVVEAADDICYRLVDFEDGFRLGELTYEEVRDAFLALMPPAAHPKRLHDAQSANRRVQILRAVAIGCALDECADIFLENEEGLLNGTFDTPLIEAGPSSGAWREIGEKSRVTIYATPRGVGIEAAGFDVLGGLLEVFTSAVCSPDQPRSRRILRLLPAENLGPAYRPLDDPYEQLLRILDFVAGMTDSYAVGLYRRLSGAALPGSRVERFGFGASGG